MYFLDSHIHLQDYKTQEVKNVVNNAAKNNILRFINPSARPDDWEAIAKIAKEYQQVIPAFGIHPWHTSQLNPDWPEKLEYYLSNFPSAMVGECGIDKLKNTNTKEQIDILYKHIHIALKYDRPLIIHAVKANNELAEILKKLPKHTIFHSFSGSAEWGLQLQKYGYYLGINFSILKKKNLEDMFRHLNLRQILLETDGPYQNWPEKTETLPQNLPSLAEKIASYSGVSLNEFLEILYNNQQCFLGD